MTLEQFYTIVNEYEKTDPEYSGLLFHISMYCQEDFLPLFEKAEAENKKLFIIHDPQKGFDKISLEPVVELENIGIK